MRRNFVIYFSIAYLLFFHPNCSLFNEPTAADSEETLLTAWEYFEMNNYDMAYTTFESVIAIDAENEEAYNGRAWCSLLLNDVESAIIDFEFALDKGNTSLDPHAGLAGAYISKDEFALAILKSNYVINTDPGYSFVHEPQINYLDMHLILAMAYFHTGDLQSSYHHILILDPDVSIDENNSSTWIYNEQQYDSYAEVLMAVIDNLDVLFGFT